MGLTRQNQQVSLLDISNKKESRHYALAPCLVDLQEACIFIWTSLLHGNERLEHRGHLIPTPCSSSDSWSGSISEIRNPLDRLGGSGQYDSNENSGWQLTMELNKVDQKWLGGLAFYTITCPVIHQTFSQWHIQIWR